MQHPNIIRVYGAEVVAETMWTTHFLAMEACVDVADDGTTTSRTLSSAVRSGAAGALAVQLELLRQIAAGLDYLHSNTDLAAHGLTHRDLKPDNILVKRLGDGTDVCKLCDFGSAKVQTAHAGQATTRGGGTEGWQSPEAMSNEGASSASDVFTLGLIFFFVLTGGLHPFGDDERKRGRAMMRFAGTDAEEEDEVDEADAKVRSKVGAALRDAAVPLVVAELVATMLRCVPARRPTAAGVLAAATLAVGSGGGRGGDDDDDDDDDDRLLCVVCLDRRHEFAVVPCGHRCLCANCLPSAAVLCPICRAPAQGTMRIFEG